MKAESNMNQFSAEAIELTPETRHSNFAVDQEGRCYFVPFLQWVVHFSKKPRKVYLVDAKAKCTLETEVIPL